VNIFNVSLVSYRNNEHTSEMLGGNDFADMITRFWRKVPKETVLEAIAEELKQAKSQVERNSGLNISMASSKGAVAFNSIYEYRLFQLLPVLKELDESGAKKMVEDYQQVQTLLAKYPQGTSSLNPSDDPNGSQIGTMSVTDGRGPQGGGNRGPRVPSAFEMQQMSKIVSDAAEHPQDALANVPSIARPELRARAFDAIARNTWKKNSGVAHQALEKLLDLVPQLDLNQQLFNLASVADTYLAMGDDEAAKKTVEKGLKVADKAYEQDSNADDPNKALKAYWPSTAAYRSFLRVAARISPAWATKVANEISDPEMKVVLQIALAEAWLDIPAGSTTIMTSTKKGSRMMMDVN
jgi:tetratricopeptide (TPR) repeat protein